MLDTLPVYPFNPSAMALTKPRKSVNGSGPSSVKVNGTAAPTVNGVVADEEASSSDQESSAASSSKAASKYAASLSQHNAAFTSLLHLIPPQFYLTKDDDEDLAAQEMMSSKYMKNKRKKAKSEIEAKERKDKMREAKKQKLDPDNFKTVTDIQTERAAAKAAKRAAEKDSDVDMDVDGMLSDDDDDDDPNTTNGAAGDTDDDFQDSDTEDVAPPPAAKSLPGSTKPIQTEGERKASIEALRAKLHAKIAGLQRKRGGLLDGGEEGSEDGGSTISSKDELLEERRKQRNQARERKKQDKKDAKTAAKANKANGAANSTKNVATKAPALLVAEPGYGGKAGASSSAANFDVNNSSINFSSLDFDPVGAAAAALPAGKKNRLALPSDPKSALQVLESRKKAEEAKRAKLANKLGEKPQELSAKISNYEEQKQWDKVLASASGVKIRDDEKLLKKAAKRKDKIKEKSSLAWNERALNEQKKEGDKQKRRTDNLAARKAGKKGKKGSSSTLSKTKTPRAKARPGFEGKKIGRGKK